MVAKQYVNKLREGHRFQAKFSHLGTLEGAYSSYGYFRVLNRTVTQLTDDFYEIAVTITPASNAGVGCGINYAAGLAVISSQTGPGAPMGTNGGEAALTDGYTTPASYPGPGSIPTFAAGVHVTGSTGLYTFRFAIDLGSAKSTSLMKLWWYADVNFETARAYYSDTGTGGAWTEVGSTTPINYVGNSPPTSISYTASSHRYWSVTIEHFYTPATSVWAALVAANSLVEWEVLSC